MKDLIKNMSQQQPQLNNHADLLLRIQNNQSNNLNTNKKNKRLKSRTQVKKKSNFLVTLLLLCLLVFSALYFVWTQGNLPSSLNKHLNVPFLHIQAYINTAKKKINKYRLIQRENNIAKTNAEPDNTEEIRTIQDRLRELQAKRDQEANNKQEHHVLVKTKDKLNRVITGNSVLKQSQDKVMSWFGKYSKTKKAKPKKQYNNYEIVNETNIQDELDSINTEEIADINISEENTGKIVNAAYVSTAPSYNSNINNYQRQEQLAKQYNAYNNSQAQDDIFFGKYRIANSYNEKLYSHKVYNKRVSQPKKQVTFKTSYLSPIQAQDELEKRLNSQNYYKKKELYNAYSRSGKAVYEYTNTNGEELYISYRPSLDKKITMWKYIYY